MLMGQFTVFFIDYVLHYYHIFSLLFLILFVQEGQQLGPALLASEFAASVRHFKDKESKSRCRPPLTPPPFVFN
jgi:hypothetical protein